jgi:hypothetical protein
MSRAAYNEYSYYNNTLIHCHPLTFAKRTLGSSFGGSKFTLPANTISINSKTCCLAGWSFGFGNQIVLPQ